MTKKELASMIDQTLLSADAAETQITDFCKKASEYGFASVCINPVYIGTAKKILEGSGVKVCTVIDFPLGAGGTEFKKTESVKAVEAGADEIDIVIDLGLVKAHEWEKLYMQLKETVDEVRKIEGRKTIIKIILETCLLTDEEIVQSSLACKKAGCDFVKTSTGFAIMKDKDGKMLPNGASVHAVELMRKTVGTEMGVKASGGIHNCKEALELIKAGASRIGASAGIQIVEGFTES